MSASYYDVVVLGTELAPLTAAAILAKRGFRVLLLGQNEPPPTYEVGGFTLPRRPFRYVLGQSPVSRRVFPELGLHQSLRRISSTAPVSFQVAMPGHRFDVGPDESKLAREMEREFPEVKRPIDDYHKRVARIAAGFDATFERDLVFPPDKFLERQRFARASKALAVQPHNEDRDMLAEFPDEHPFRRVAALPARFEADIDPEHMAPLRTLRLYGNCQSGALDIQGGLPALRELLQQRIRAHSGQVRLNDRAHEILLRGQRVKGVRLGGSGEEISAGYVLVGMDVAAMLRLLQDRSPFETLFERVGEPLLRHYRYTLNVVIRARGLPIGMASEIYLLRAPDGTGVAEQTRVQTHDLDADHKLLCVETLLPSRRVEEEEGFLGRVRPALLHALRDLVPFLDVHTVLVDSPHDGIAPEGADTTLDANTQARRGPSTMPTVYGYPVVSTLDVCALPIRTPIKRLLLCNGQVVPGLGSEGALLTACSAARVVTTADRGKSWMRRRLWTKVEY